MFTPSLLGFQCFELIYSKTGILLCVSTSTNFNTDNHHHSWDTKQFHHPPKCPSYYPLLSHPNPNSWQLTHLVSVTAASVRKSPKWNHTLGSLLRQLFFTQHERSGAALFTCSPHAVLTPTPLQDSKGPLVLPASGQQLHNIPCTSS